MRFLVLFYQVSVALCALSFSCLPLEKSRYGKYPRIIVSNDWIRNSSALIYRREDATRFTSIPEVIDQRLIDKKTDGFTVCSEELLHAGQCSTVGEFVFETKDGAQVYSKISNAVLSKGDTLAYTGYSHGTYCVAIYQDAWNIDGVSLDVKHSYGSLSLEQAGYGYSIELIVVFEFLLLSVLCAFGETRCHLPPFALVHALLCIDFISRLFQFILLCFANSYPFLINETLLRIGECFCNIIEFVAVTSTLYCFSINVHPLTDFEQLPGNDPERTASFRSITENYLSVSVFAVVVDTVNSDSVISQLLRFIEIVVCTQLWDIYSFNSRRTIEEIIDPVYIRKFKMSLSALFYISISMVFLPIVYQAFVSLGVFFCGITTDGLPKTPFTVSMEQCLENEWLFLLRNSTLFIIPLFCCALVLIWYPYRPLSETDNVNGHVSTELGHMETHPDANPSAPKVRNVISHGGEVVGPPLQVDDAEIKNQVTDEVKDPEENKQ